MRDVTEKGGSSTTARVLRVAVIIPAKNEAANISDCLDAIRRQDCPAAITSILVVDNGSSDSTRALAQRSGVPVLQDGAASVAGLRNQGAASFSAQGWAPDILAFLDADMVPDSSWLSAAIRALYPTDVGAAGGALTISDQSTWVARAWAAGRSTKPNWAEVRWLPAGNFLVKYAAFCAVGGFDGRLTSCEDVDICARLRDAGYKLVYSRDIAALHTGEPGTVCAMFKKELWRGRNSLGRLSKIAKHPAEIPSVVLPILQLFMLAAVMAFAVAGRFNSAAIFAVMTLVLPVARAATIGIRTRAWRHFWNLVAVWYVYYLARALACVVRPKW